MGVVTALLTRCYKLPNGPVPEQMRHEIDNVCKCAPAPSLLRPRTRGLGAAGDAPCSRDEAACHGMHAGRRAVCAFCGQPSKPRLGRLDTHASTACLRACRAVFPPEGGRAKVPRDIKDTFVEALHPNSPNFPPTVSDLAECLKGWRNRCAPHPPVLLCSLLAQRICSLPPAGQAPIEDHLHENAARTSCLLRPSQASN